MIANASDLVVNRWGAKYRGQTLPCAIGRSGISQKRGEGDGITPVGVFTIELIGLRPDRVSLRTPNLDQFQILPRDGWSDDPKDPDYNHLIDRTHHKWGHEALRRSDPLYDAIGVLDYNWPEAKPGKGSAIFIHGWRKSRHPTEGCIAFHPLDLYWIFETWSASSRVIIKP